MFWWRKRNSPVTSSSVNAVQNINKVATSGSVKTTPSSLCSTDNVLFTRDDNDKVVVNVVPANAPAVAAAAE
jgi:hypothetical protein